MFRWALLAIWFVVAISLFAADSDHLLIVDQGVFGAEEVHFSEDGRYVVVKTPKHYALWDVKSRSTIVSFAMPVHSSVVAISNDVKLAAIRQYHGQTATIALWHLRLGRRLHDLGPHNWDAQVAFSPRNDVMAIANDQRIEIIDVVSGKRIREFGSTCHAARAQEELRGRGYHPGAQDGTLGPLTAAAIELFQKEHRLASDGRLTDGVCRELGLSAIAHGTSISAIAFTPDGGSLITAARRDETDYGYGSSIVIWHWLDGTIAQRFATFDERFDKIAFSRDGCFVFLSGSKVRAFAVEGGQELATRESDGSRYYSSIVDVSRDGQRILVADNAQRAIAVWQWQKNSDVRTIPVGDLIFDAVFANANEESVLISARTGLFTGEIVDGKLTPLSDQGNLRALRAVEFSPDGHYLTASTWGGAYVWDLTTGAVRATDTVHGTGTLWNSLWGSSTWLYNALRITDDGLLVGVSYKGAISSWALATGNYEGTFTVNLTEGEGPTMDVVGAFLVVPSREPGLRLLQRNDGVVVDSFAEGVAVSAAALSQDGQLVAAGGRDGVIRIFDRRGGSEPVVLSADCFEIQCSSGRRLQVTDLRFSRNGNLLLSFHADRGPQVWNIAGRRRVRSFPYRANPDSDALGTPDEVIHSGATAAAMSPDETLIAVAYGNGRLIVSEIESGRERFRNAIPGTSLWGVAWSPEGRYLAVTGNDYVLRLWDVLTEADVATLRVFDGDNWLLVSSDGRYNGTRRGLLALRVVSDGISRRLPDDVFSRRSADAFRFASINEVKGPVAVVAAPSPAPQLGTYRRKFAVVIGVAKYARLRDRAGRGELANLKFAARDASEFEAFLRDEGISGGGWRITTLLNDRATAQAVDDALTTVLTQAEEEDFVIIFFSGHGRAHPLRPQDVYLLTHDFDPDEARSGYSYTVLQQMIADTKAQHVVAFIDACRSGEIGFGDKAGSPAGTFSQDVFERLQAQSPPNRLIFSSGRGTQISNEDSEASLGVFTKFVLRGLKGEAPDRKNPRYVDLGELRDYVKDAVVNYCRRTGKPIQVPELWEKHGLTHDDFPLAIRR